MEHTCIIKNERILRQTQAICKKCEGVAPEYKQYFCIHCFNTFLCIKCIEKVCINCCSKKEKVCKNCKKSYNKIFKYNK